jgi:hypothetical protein
LSCHLVVEQAGSNSFAAALILFANFVPKSSSWQFHLRADDQLRVDFGDGATKSAMPNK